ncbi:MAG: AmmeMemoRadiSam system protein B [Oscillospiraceae bacterium]|nr:AmmeMemoRadiSam system protein B [Oscillospiraceae bacterium]
MPIIAGFVFPHPPLLIPEIGKGEERKVAKTSQACDECARFIADLKPDTIILSSPHAKAYYDAFHISEPDEEFDHGALVPLYFVNQYYEDYRLVRISLSGLSFEEHFNFGKEIAGKTGNERVVYIASGDLSHKLKADGPYGFAPEGVEFDKIVTEALNKGDFEALLNIDSTLQEKAAECGLRSFVIMAGALDGLKTTPKLLSYENTFGVGYAVAAFTVNR